MIPVLILAAGQSRRMRGADKLMQDVDSKPLLRRQIEIAAPIGTVYVALPDLTHARATALNGTSAIPFGIAESNEGIGGTLRGAVSRMPKGPFMLLLGDLISLLTNDLRGIIDVLDKHPDHLVWRGATPDGKGGHPIIFHESLIPEFAKLSGDTGGETIVKPLKSRTYLHLFPDNRARHDLDTPEEWAAWRNLR